MVKPAPKIDERTAADIAKQVQDLLARYAPEWQEFELDPVTGDRKPKGISAALIGVFARFAEIIIQRLNQVPDKNFLAFLNLLGASRLPPQPARVPLTFFLTAGSTVDAIVPAGTQVAAPPAEGEKDPVIFETERELVVTSANLESIYVLDPERDRYADYSRLATLTDGTTPSTPVGSLPVFQGDQQIEHSFYIGHSKLLGFSNIERLLVTINLKKGLGDSGELSWQLWNGKEWENREPSGDKNLTKSGRGGSNEVNFGGLIEAIPLSSVDTQENRWLRCRLITPITLDAESRTRMVRSEQLPLMATVSIQVQLAPRSNLVIKPAFSNFLPIDTSKPFFPFGEKPRLGDAFYLANPEAFSQKDATITLKVNLANPAQSTPNEQGISSTKPSTDLKLTWEFWNGQEWKELGIAETLKDIQNNNAAQFRDTTQAFTKSGEVGFKLYEKPEKTTINGEENFWVRVRISSGNYGVEARYRLKVANKPEDGYVLEPATFRPPLLNSIVASYTLTLSAEPEEILTYNDFEFAPVTLLPESSVELFKATQIGKDSKATQTDKQASKPGIYLGFTVPANAKFPNRPLSLFCRVVDFKYGEREVPVSPTQSQLFGNPGSEAVHNFWITNSASKSVSFTLSTVGMRWQTSGGQESFVLSGGDARQVEVRVRIPADAPSNSRDRAFLKLIDTDNPAVEYTANFETVAGSQPPAGKRPQLTWQYWNGTQWSQLSVRDDSENFTRPGVVEFLPPRNFTPKKEFGLPPRYWLRVIWVDGDYSVLPKLNWMLLNTAIASQTVTFRNEILGSSDGTENQKFRTTRSPILNGQHLQVRELEMPAVEEQNRIKQAEGDDAISLTLDATGRPQEIWVRWHEVSDFYGSQPRDRHYVIDRLTGEIQFGNGINGLIPPAGSGNLRMARYQTGGGVVGNKPAGSIVQLKTTVPYVDKVTNVEAAAGGADAEDLTLLRDRAPRTLRHNNRATTLDDYEDLAMLATPEVARAKCVPLRNLLVDPLDEQSTVAGEVSVIIVPRSNDAKPLPSIELINRVQSYLKTCSVATANITVVGALYISVDVTVEIALTSLEKASIVEQAVAQKLARFLHPLTGGFDGTGWAFGRTPHKSDLYALIEPIPGVDYIRTLDVPEDQEYQEYRNQVKKTGRFLVYSGNHKITFI